MTLNGIHAGLRPIIQSRITAGRTSIKLLSHQTGLSKPHLSLYVHGESHLSVRALSRVLDALGFGVEVRPKQ